MEKKKKASAKKRSAGEKGSEVLVNRILGMALDLSAKEGWSSITPARLAETLAVPYGQVFAICPTRTAIAVQLIRRLDRQVLDQVRDVDPSESPRDRLFEVLMMRFDALQEHRDSYVGLIRHTQTHPAALLIIGPKVLHSMALTLIIAGITTDGLIGAVRTKALAAALSVVVKTWLKDDSADLAATMAALDKALGRLESAAIMLQSCTRRRPAESDKG